MMSDELTAMVAIISLPLIALFLWILWFVKVSGQKDSVASYPARNGTAEENAELMRKELEALISYIRPKNKEYSPEEINQAEMDLLFIQHEKEELREKIEVVFRNIENYSGDYNRFANAYIDMLGEAENLLILEFLCLQTLSSSDERGELVNSYTDLALRFSRATMNIGSFLAYLEELPESKDSSLFMLRAQAGVIQEIIYQGNLDKLVACSTEVMDIYKGLADNAP